MNGRPDSKPVGASARRSGSRRVGVVLILVLIVIVLVGLMGLSFVLTLSTENRATHIQAEELQLEQVAASGVECVKALVEQAPSSRREQGSLADNAAIFQGVLVIDDANPAYRARFSIVSPPAAESAETVRYGVQNESARLNLGVLMRWEEAKSGAAQQALMQLPGMTEAIAAAMLDWLDADDEPRTDGAEAEFYRNQQLPYGPRNAAATSLEELLLVRDVTREQLLGLDANRNYTVSEREQQVRSAAAEAATAWESLLTVYSAERNIRGDGRPRIPLNEKDLAKLRQQLSEAFDAQQTRFILAYRQYGPTDAPAGPPAVAAPRGPKPPDAASPGEFGAQTDDEPPIDLAAPARFPIDSPLDLIGVRVKIPPSGPPRPPRGRRRFSGRSEEAPPPPEGEVLESPWPDDPVALAESLPKLIDATTTDPAPVLYGRINVNEAPREVLMAVPGLEATVADQIVSARTGEQGDRASVAWLWTEGIVDRATLRRLLPYLTTEGDVYRGQVVAGFEGKNRWMRAEFVIDASASPPKQVYWKDLRLLGRGFSASVLAASTEVPQAENEPSEEWSEEELPSEASPPPAPPAGAAPAEQAF